MLAGGEGRNCKGKRRGVMKRWIIVIESFAIMSMSRYSYEEYASLGAALDRQNAINAEAELSGRRVRASLVDQKKNQDMPISLLAYTV